jgi:uncharacterized protein (DUF4415 family)
MPIATVRASRIHIPTGAEDEALTRAAQSDPDNPPLTDEELANMRPAREILPQLIGENAARLLLKTRGRPPLREQCQVLT